MNDYAVETTQRPDERVNELFSTLIEYHGRIKSRVAAHGIAMPEDEDAMRDAYAQLKTLTGSTTKRVYPDALPLKTSIAIPIVTSFIAGLRDDLGMYTIGKQLLKF